MIGQGGFTEAALRFFSRVFGVPDFGRILFVKMLSAISTADKILFGPVQFVRRARRETAGGNIRAHTEPVA
ncbi:hypothetical protein CKA38_01070 [Ereboglobus luteus]|uniref:Uncharacterized protein n=1 Tax=Ereboglobus luteus TaxID=1796921 RepID=A0A2U8DZQ8_9BACT|nr:hypothetical protein CKA38_01070 [Ereboglobus luteus]